MPEAAELLTALRPGSWALVTSGSRGPVHRRFALAGLPLPRVQVYGEDVRESKPHPEGCLPAAHRPGVDPARCVVVEDAPAGVAAGCTGVGLTASHPGRGPARGVPLGRGSSGRTGSGRCCAS